MAEERVEITTDHLNTIREKWDCKDMSDNDIISAMLHYEKMSSGGVRVLESLCFPNFQSHLHYITQQKHTIAITN